KTKKKAADLTITTARTFASLDGSADDDDGLVNGVFLKNGNLTITGTGSITCNDPASPSASGACPMIIHVTGDMEMQDGAAILAQNLIGGGSGGAITITVDGSMTMRGSGATGATIDSSAVSGTTGDGGNISITVGGFTAPPTGDFTMEPGSSIHA